MRHEAITDLMAENGELKAKVAKFHSALLTIAAQDCRHAAAFVVKTCPNCIAEAALEDGAGERVKSEKEAFDEVFSREYLDHLQNTLARHDATELLWMAWQHSAAARRR